MAPDSDSGQIEHPRAGDAPLTSLHNFSLLSYELQAKIIALACQKPALHDKTTATEEPTSAAVRLDAQTTISLALVCKSFHEVATRTLYAHLRITRPSTLQLLVSAVTGRPVLGTFIKSLHIGPDSALPADWHPLNTCRLFRSAACEGLSSRYAEWGRVIHWRVDSGFWDLYVEPSELPPAIEAIKQAVDYASLWRNIDPTSPAKMPREGPRGYHYRYGPSQPLGWEPQQESMPFNDWFCHLCEVGAATELYIEQLARHEDKGVSLQDQPKVCFPRLVLEGMTASPFPWVGRIWHGPTVTFSKEHVRARLAKPGGSIDRFDHPLLLARSKIEWSAWDAWQERDKRDYYRPRSGDFSWNAIDESAFLERGSSLQSTRFQLAQSADGSLNLAHSLLSRTPQLRHLSLTGFLEHAISGPQVPLRLQALESVSLGPPDTFWVSVPLPPLRSSAIAGVQRLQVCGHVLDQQQAALIVGGAFPRLRALRWSYPKHIRDDRENEMVRILETVATLLGLNASPALGHHDDYPSDPLFVEACLHPRDLVRVLIKAPDLATRAAWRSGERPPAGSPCPHRFRVTSHADNVHQGHLREMYKEGRDWIEEGLKGTGGYA